MTDLKNITSSEEGKNKNAPVNMRVIAIILAGVMLLLIVLFIGQRHRMVEMEEALTQEKDSLANELRRMVVAYDTLKTNNDTLNASLLKERTRIVDLLAINASNTQLIKKYKGEIKTMREIMKNYIIQIDSLNTRNKSLVAENTEIRHQMKQVRNTNTELSKAREELSNKVEIASIIQAKDIVAVALNKKRKETSRINMLDKIRICFTLRENPLAKAGQKEVYMRILRPDSLVITTSPDNSFEYNKSKIIYSASRVVDYMNQDIEMCIFMDNTGDFTVGTYSVELYLEGNIIGKSTFMLTKK